MFNKWGVALAVVLLASILAVGSLSASTDNYVINLSGGREGYSTAIITDPDKIPVLVIQPIDDTRLEDLAFEIRLLNAYWDFESFRQAGIDNYGTIDKDGIFTPEDAVGGYLTGKQSPQGVTYKMEVSGKREVAVVTLDHYYPVSSSDAIYIPILAEITGSPASVELYDPYGSDLSTEGIQIFASGSAGGITTQVRPGEIKEFSQIAALSDLTIRELIDRAMVGGVLTMRAPTGYRWVNIDQIQLSGRNTSDMEIASRALATEGPAAVTNASVLRLELSMKGNAAGVRTIVLKNLQLEAAPGNDLYNAVSITLSGCNMEQEAVIVANRVKVDYTFAAESQALPELIAGNNPSDAVAESMRVLKVTLEESVSGRWRASGKTTFTLPAGVKARAVMINTAGFETDLPKDTLIRRRDENAFALNTDNSGIWTLSADGLTVQSARTDSGKKAKLELTFYLSADKDFRGPVYITAGGNALTNELAAAVAEVVERAAAGSVILTIGSMEMVAGGEIVIMDVAPYIENGYTMVPVSYVARAMGLPADGVGWDGDARAVTIRTDKKVAVLTIDSREMKVDGVTVEIAAAPVIRDNRTFLPFRVLGEQVLGVAVGWDAEARTAAFYE